MLHFRITNSFDCVNFFWDDAIPFTWIEWLGESTTLKTAKYFYAPTLIDRGHIVFWPVCLSVLPFVHLFVRKIFHIGHIFWLVELGPSYFTWVHLVTRPFCWYQVQGHLSRSNNMVTVFEKMTIVWAFVFHKHILFFLTPNLILDPCWWHVRTRGPRWPCIAPLADM